MLVSRPPLALVLLAGFVLFRVFDVVKVSPADRTQRLAGGVGVMIDDVIGGLYALGVLSGRRTRCSHGREAAARVVGGGRPGRRVTADVAAVSPMLETAGAARDEPDVVEPDEGARARAATRRPASRSCWWGRRLGGRPVRRAIARAAGARLVLNDRILGPLTAHYRGGTGRFPAGPSVSRYCRRAPPCGPETDVEPGWAVESAEGIVAVLPRGVWAQATADLAPHALRAPCRPSPDDGPHPTDGRHSPADVEERLTRLARPVRARST